MATSILSAEASASRSEARAFPYAFPQAGNYTVWVQVKRAGKIQTAAFRVIVKP